MCASCFSQHFIIKVSLEGVTRFSSPSPQKFVGFFLTIERNNDEKTAFSRYEEDDLGSFTILYPALSKISEKCPNVVVNTNSVPKSDVLVRLTSLLIYYTIYKFNSLMNNPIYSVRTDRMDSTNIWKRLYNIQIDNHRTS